MSDVNKNILLHKPLKQAWFQAEVSIFKLMLWKKIKQILPTLVPKQNRKSSVEKILFKNPKNIHIGGVSGGGEFLFSYCLALLF